jgi:hypothetical protein
MTDMKILEEQYSNAGRFMGLLNKRFAHELKIRFPEYDGPWIARGGIGYKGKKGYYHAFDWTLNDIANESALDDMEKALRPWLEKAKNIDEENDGPV